MKKDWRGDFKRLLAPRLLTALRKDISGAIPLKAAQHRQIRAMLRIIMKSDEIDKAIGVLSRRRPSAQPRASAGVKKPGRSGRLPGK